jgi:F-type H+-transporting ATPase subunit b
MAIISSAFAAEDAAHDAHAGVAAPEHGAAHEGGFPPFETQNFAPQLIWLVLIFGVLYVLLSRIALPRVGKILSDRESKIAADLDTARSLQTKAQEAAAANDATLAAKRAEAQAIGRDSAQKVTAEVAAQRAAVESDFAAKLAAADARIVAAKAQALGNVEQIATDAAGAIIEKLTGGRVDAAMLAAEFNAVKAQ